MILAPFSDDDDDDDDDGIGDTAFCSYCCLLIVVS